MLKNITKAAVVLCATLVPTTAFADDGKWDFTDGDDTAAMLLVIDHNTDGLCKLVTQAVADGNDPDIVVDHGVEAFEITFDPTDTVVAYMRRTLTRCLA